MPKILKDVRASFASDIQKETKSVPYLNFGHSNICNFASEQDAPTEFYMNETKMRYALNTFRQVVDT